MRVTRGLLIGCALLAAAPTAAQSGSPSAAPTHDVVVVGQRSKPSGWREAETAHVILLSDGPEAETIGFARDLERLHFLLSGLLGRSSAPDDLVKIRVTLIGDVADFESLDLRNRRWQQGPYNDLFTLTRYYDPREDGAVMATTRVDQRTVIEKTDQTPERVLGVITGVIQNGASAGNVGPSNPGAAGTVEGQAAEGALLGDLATANMLSAGQYSPGTGAKSITVTAESLLLAGYAQHYLTTYFPAAYPRWYLDGFGEVFSSLRMKGPNTVLFGQSPEGAGDVLSEFGGFPIGKLLDDSYLHADPGRTKWTPIHAWMVVHYLLFSDQRRPQLRQYLQLRAQGADPATAAKAFGDPGQLAQDIRKYLLARKPYEQVTLPAGQIEQPTVRRLSEGEAAFIRGRLELGSRIVIPPAPDPSTPADQAARMTRARDEALKGREAWLGRLRREADRWNKDLQAQLLLAEAECRSGNADPCVAAATRAAAIAPSDPRPLAWRGYGLVLAAAALPADRRGPALADARRVIGAANHLDNDAVEPLLAYYQSYAAAGEAPPVNAIDALQKAVGEVPNAPESRLQLGAALAARGQLAVARQVVMPIAAGPYDSPERPAAQAIAARGAAAAAP